MQTQTESATVEFANSLIGIDISAQQMVQLCDNLQLGPVTITTEDGMLTLTVQVVGRVGCQSFLYFSHLGD